MPDVSDRALALGLVDRIAYLDDVVSSTKKALGVDEARVVMYHRPREYRATIYSEAATVPGSSGALAQLTGFLGGLGPRFMYLWWP